MQLNSASFAEKVLYALLLVTVVVQFFNLSILADYEQDHPFSWGEVPGIWSKKFASSLTSTGEENDIRQSLSCSKYGGPSDRDSAEMKYWREIPSDWDYVSPFQSYGPNPKYLVFELDVGGWNNVRMATETAVAMAAATGRTLVLPPLQTMNKLNSTQNGQKTQFRLQDFFDFRSLQQRIPSLKIISMDDFLNREGVTGHLHQAWDSLHFPPRNRTNWDGMLRNSDGGSKMELFQWLRNVTHSVDWDCDRCIAGFPMQPETTHNLKSIFEQSMARIANQNRKDHIMSYSGHPTPVDATTDQRLLEMVSARSRLCLYDEQLQQERVLTLMGDNGSKARMLVHFYAFLFFEDWRQDLLTKRLIRDQLRYKDEIVCAAARVVQALRSKAKEPEENPMGNFYSLHIRRGDFPAQFPDTRADPAKLLHQVQDVVPDNATVYIATDEKDRQFFDVFRQHYHVYFLEDFSSSLLASLNTNYYGMVDQMVAARGSVFMGTFYSTFTGYINRLRGYYSQKEKSAGYEEGELQSYYLVPVRRRNYLLQYQALHPPLWAREFPIAWRDIDKESHLKG